jgi:dnd system-associated protein 4
MRSLRLESEYEPMVRQFAEKTHPDSRKSIFPTMREFMCFAAVVGFHEGKRTPLKGDTFEIDARIFQNSQQAIDLLYLIALAGSRDVNILREERDDELTAIFEEYANGGLAKIADWIRDRPDDVNGDKALLTAFEKADLLEEKDTNLSSLAGDVQF